MIWLHAQSALGIVAIIAAAWGLSENRRAFRWRFVAAALALQMGLAFLFLDVEPARRALLSLNKVVDALSAATIAGTGFVFGYVGGGAAPFDVTQPANMANLAFQALPLILVMSAFSALLWHWRILPLVVNGFAWVLKKALGIGGATGLASAATMFLGMIEAPLLIRPYIAKLSRSELFTLLTVGLASVAGTVMVLYATILSPVVPGALGHILVASFLSLPAGVMIAQIMVPGDTTTEREERLDGHYRSSIDALAQGTQDGLGIYLNVLALLIVAVALIALANFILGALPPVGGGPLTVERAFGWLFAPVVWLYGVPWSEAGQAGALMGTKTILNEFLAYLKMAALPEGALSPRSKLIMLYAMCGFANVGSVGIMIAGLNAMAPERRAEIAQLATRALISGTMASGMTGAVIGLLPAG